MRLSLILSQKTDLEIDVALDKTITVFRYLSDKDVFERYYKGHLAKRLLLGRSVSDDAERQMLGKLKVECGHQFTQKLEGMFNDMKLSAETMEGYKAHLERTTVRGTHIPRSSDSNTSAGTFSFYHRHSHDCYLLAVSSQRHMYSTGRTRESIQVIRNVLPLKAHWSKAYLAAIYGYRRCPGTVQVEEARFDSFHHCTRHSSAIRGTQGRRFPHI